MTRRTRAPVPLIAAACVAALGATEAALADPCRPSRLEAANQAAVNERLDLELAEGRVIRLAGVESPLARGAQRSLLQAAADDVALWTSAPISIFVLSAQPDRWRRLTGRAFVAEHDGGTTHPPSLSEAIIDAGIARVDPGTETRPCLDALYAAEQRARFARRGLWADPSFAVLDAENPQNFSGVAGALAIVEGHVASVRAGRGVTFVNLGDGRPQSPALTVGRQALRAMQRVGLKPEALAGRSIRARGVLDHLAGPRIEVAGPDAIEILPASASRPRRAAEPM